MNNPQHTSSEVPLPTGLSRSVPVFRSTLHKYSTPFVSHLKILLYIFIPIYSSLHPLSLYPSAPPYLPLHSQYPYNRLDCNDLPNIAFFLVVLVLDQWMIRYSNPSIILLLSPFYNLCFISVHQITTTTKQTNLSLIYIHHLYLLDINPNQMIVNTANCSFHITNKINPSTNTILQFTTYIINLNNNLPKTNHVPITFIIHL